LWTLAWRPKQPGYHTVLSRATDVDGKTQPLVPTWNPSGYLFNAVDRIGLSVEARS
jgi:hypothetical protein